MNNILRGKQAIDAAKDARSDSLAQSKLMTAVKLSFPIISICSNEYDRAKEILKELAENSEKNFYAMEFKCLPSPDVITKIRECKMKNKVLHQGSNGQDEWVDEKTTKKQNGLVIFDPFFFDRVKVNPETLPALRSSLPMFESEGINYFVVGPQRLDEDFAYSIDLPNITEVDIEGILAQAEHSFKQATAEDNATEDEIHEMENFFSDEEAKQVINNARGLSQSQLKNLFHYSVFLKRKDLDFLSEIRTEKAQLLSSKGLEIKSPVSLSDIGGLEKLKEFLKIRKSGWDANFPTKGILLAGMPGSGKTLAAKAVANIFGVSLVALKMDRFYSKMLGETERQFQEALDVIDRVSPLVLFIDEIEKYFGNSGEGHEVSKRLLGTFLSWLQDRKGQVFVVATANRVEQLPSELIRAGRWDASFFVGLPNDCERRAILNIHIKKHDAKILDDNELTTLVRNTDSYTGAEIEAAIVNAKYKAHHLKCDISAELISEEIKLITPMSVSRKEDMLKIMDLKNQGFVPASAKNEPIAVEVKSPRMGRQLVS